MNPTEAETQAIERVMATLRAVEITGANDGTWTAYLDEDQAYAAILRELQEARRRALEEAGCERDPECMEPPPDEEPCTTCRLLAELGEEPQP